jgi:hypothetical protein
MIPLDTAESATKVIRSKLDFDSRIAYDELVARTHFKEKNILAMKKVFRYIIELKLYIIYIITSFSMITCKVTQDVN